MGVRAGFTINNFFFLWSISRTDKFFSFFGVSAQQINSSKMQSFNLRWVPRFFILFLLWHLLKSCKGPCPELQSSRTTIRPKKLLHPKEQRTVHRLAGPYQHLPQAFRGHVHGPLQYPEAPDEATEQ